MSENWAEDVRAMHDKYGFADWVVRLNAAQLGRLLSFRIAFLKEELRELDDAENAEDVVDALVDVVVVAIGTLDLFGVDKQRAWDEVHRANMSKRVGVKEGRPQDGSFPDLVKDPGWVAPSHAGNHGLLAVAMGTEEDE